MADVPTRVEPNKEHDAKEAGEETMPPSQPLDPPRLRLRIHSAELPGNLEDAVPGEVVLQPGEPGYDAVFARAATAYRELGIPMPYAEDAPPDIGEEQALVSRPPSDDPPRLPLRVRVPAGAQGPQGHPQLLDHWRDVWPGDPDYEAIYRRAVHAWRVAGTALPYADAQDRTQAGESGEQAPRARGGQGDD